MREKIIDAISKISRGTAIFLLFSFVVGAIFQMPAAQNFLADFLVSPSRDSIRRDFLENHFDHFQKLSGAEFFLEKAKKWTAIKRVKIRAFSSGIFVSFDAAEKDVLHRYFAVFQMKNGAPEKMIFPARAIGKMSGIAKTADQKFLSVALKNVGDIPWIAAEKWENAADDSKIILTADADPGETGVFLFPKNDAFLPKNATHDFFIWGK